MSVHTRERKRLWCLLFGHAHPIYLRGEHGPVVVCSRCGGKR